MDKRMANHFSSTWGIVLAGGSGRRLEPMVAELTRTVLPKQFCAFGQNKESLLQETLWRIIPAIHPERLLVVTRQEHESLASHQLEGFPGVLQIVQPRDRGTAAGILLPLLHVWRQDPDATVVVLPSDHAISRTDLFEEGIRKARIAVERAPLLVVVGGVEATEPNSDYGWIVPRVATEFSHGPCLRCVDRFVEKPRSAEAERLLASGGLWSTFILVAKARALVRLFRMTLPEGLSRLADRDPLDRSVASRAQLADRYERLPIADFSRDVLSTADRLAVLAWPSELGWTDLGTPGRLLRWLALRGDLDRITTMRRHFKQESLAGSRDALAVT